MRILEGSEFCFSLLSFSKLLLLLFFFSALSYKAMRLSIGSVVVVLVAEKGSVWVCRFFVENTIWQRRMEIFCKTAGLNLHNLKTRIYLCHQNSHAGRKGLILNCTMENERLLYVIWETNSAFPLKAIKRSPRSWAMAETSVDAECNVARSAGRQGEWNEMKHIL